ncbi:MAG: agmatine deiminase family protein [Phycisphaerae bacterium]
MALAVRPTRIARGLKSLENYDPQRDGALPRTREGGRPELDPNRPLLPYRLDLGGPEMPPTSGLIASPPEYSPAQGVIFRYSSAEWPTVVRDCVVALTSDSGTNDIAYVVVANASQQTSASTLFAAGGANMSKVQFIQLSNNSIWLRDYGPHFIWQDGVRAIVDSHYYPTRPLDNYIPTLLGKSLFGMTAFPMGLYYSGGNFQPGPNRSGFITDIVLSDNPFTTALVQELYQAYQGIDTLHIFPALPASVDGTGHIDMWMYLVDDNDVIISEFLPGSNATAISITNNAVPYMQALGFTVHRTPAWNVGSTHYTYTNAFRVSNRIFVPIYGPGNPSYSDEDAQAVGTWQAAAGAGVTIVPINCYDIIPAAGAIHCIVMQVPRYDDAAPKAKVLAPDGGDTLRAGQTCEIRWGNDDNLGVTAVDLYYSTDGGATYPNLIAANEPADGAYLWTVPTNLSKHVRIRVVAHDASANQGTSDSFATLTVACTSQHVYDFNSGAGVDKFAWGSATTSWSQLNGVRRPAAVGTQLSAANYARLATSNATGGDTDANRYISPIPAASSETTHIFEFAIGESPAQIRQIDARWEGYGDDCIQMEMYVWDYTQNNWGDGHGLVGETRFMDHCAGNEDKTLEGRITSNFGRYVSGGPLTLLLYGERSAQESFHDYLSVTVTFGTRGDLDFDGAVTAADAAMFIDVLLGRDADPARVAAADANCDGATDATDVQAFVSALFP